MKTPPLLVPVCIVLCIISSCSKKSSDATPAETDYSQCLLSGWSYTNQTNLLFSYDGVTVQYNSDKKIKQQTYTGIYSLYTYETGKNTINSYINSIVDSNLAQRDIYTLSNDRITLHTRINYFKPGTVSQRTDTSKTEYTYDGEGYLTGQKLYKMIAPSFLLQEDRKFSYQGGNLVQRENIYYDVTNNPGTKLGGDTITYSYDNTTWYPEATRLYVVTNVETGKPNKNNITGIQLKLYDPSKGLYDQYKSIQYTYVEKGKRLDKATFSATTTKGASSAATISFTYQCN